MQKCGNQLPSRRCRFADLPVPGNKHDRELICLFSSHSQIELSDSEFVKEVSGTFGMHAGVVNVINSIKLLTNVQGNCGVAAFFGRSGKFLDAKEEVGLVLGCRDFGAETEIGRTTSRSLALGLETTRLYSAPLGGWRGLGARAESVVSWDAGLLLSPHWTGDRGVLFAKRMSYRRGIPPRCTCRVMVHLCRCVLPYVFTSLYCVVLVSNKTLDQRLSDGVQMIRQWNGYFHSDPLGEGSWSI